MIAVMMWWCFLVLAIVVEVSGQGEGVNVECYSSSSVVGAVLGTLFIVAALEAAAYFLWRLYWRKCRGQHLVCVTDFEKGVDFAFDNPCFRDATTIPKVVLETKPIKAEQKSKWPSGTEKTPWAGLESAERRRRRALDDSFASPPEPQVTQVSLRSHDFTGLGFNICGNMRDGIFVKDVLNRGPASESGCICPGDRIHSIRISLRHMVFEDALTILSYASPYEVTLEVESGTMPSPASRPSSLLRRERQNEKDLAAADRICHPFYRSQSSADLAQIGKTHQKRVHAIETKHGRVSPEKGDFGSAADYLVQKLGVQKTSAPLPSSTPIKEVVSSDNAAIIAPSSTVVVKPRRDKKSPDSIDRMQKLGVRVLPVPDVDDSKRTFASAEKHQNTHNTYLERGIDVPESYARSSAVHDNAAFDDVDLGTSPLPPEDHHHHPDEETHSKMGVVAKDMKTKLSKGLQNLKDKLHSLERKKSTSKPEAQSVENHELQEDQPAHLHTEEVLIRKPSGRGIPTEIPEEVRLAAVAARSNRKSLGMMMSSEPEAEVRTASRNSSASNDSAQEPIPPAKKSSKRKAPRPPEETSVVPAVPDQAPPPQEYAKEPERPSSDAQLHSDSDSEMEPPPQTTIELTASHITIHHSPTLVAEEETTRKAASLGDLSRFESQLPTVTILERAVSLDLVDGTPQGGKKRKAPPIPGSTEEDLMAELDDAINSRKEPRLDNALNTFERRRLKKSSDWGTLEEALDIHESKSPRKGSKSDEGFNMNQQVLILSGEGLSQSPQSSDLGSSFLVGMKFSHRDDDQPFSFTAKLDSDSLKQPLSIEVRHDSSELGNNASEREKILWSIPGQENRVLSNGTSLVNVNSSPSRESLDRAVTPVEYNSLNLVSSTPIHPDGPVRGQYITTTQLNSLEDNTDISSRAEAFVTAMESTLLDDEEPPPDLPTSPIPRASPMSSLTYITEIQVTTPDSGADTITNGNVDSSDGVRKSSESDNEVVALNFSYDSPSNNEPHPVQVVTSSPPTLNGSTSVSIYSDSPRSSTSPVTTKASRNVNVTPSQTSRIPVRSSSHSPEDRSSRPRPPVPARRSADFSQNNTSVTVDMTRRVAPRQREREDLRKTPPTVSARNGVQVVSPSESKDVQ